MKILITGASGFIGRNLLLRLASESNVIALYNKDETFVSFLDEYNLDPMIFRIDLTNKKSLERLKETIGNEIDVCVFLAANGDPVLSVEQPAWDLECNTVSLINTCLSFNVKRFIFMSSGAVYDGLEDGVSPDIKVSPTLPYAISKWASERYIEHFHKTGKIGEYVILRFFGAFGPHEPSRKIYSNLVKTFYLEGKDEFTIIGDGKNLIDAMPIDDAICGLEKVINSDRSNLIANFHSGRPLAVKELVKTIGKIFDKRISIKYVGIIPEYIKFWAIGKDMKTEFGFEPTLSLEYGLEKLTEFIVGVKNNEL